jgi:hypothetical protein
MAPFFDSNQPYYRLIREKRFPEAVDAGLHWLEQEKKSNPPRYASEPKGTPFYLLGIAAFASHDYQTATFLFDAAVSEDLQHYPANPNTPALLFMRLDDQMQEQAALPIVKIITATLQTAVNDYTARKEADALTPGDVREHFLKHVLKRGQPHLRTLTTTLVSFFLERDFRLKMIDLSQAGSREAFFTHLFMGCLLFESLLKENPKKHPTEKTLGELLRRGGAVPNKLGINKPLKTDSGDFDAIVRALKPSQPITEAIKSTVQTRNTLGHNLAWLTKSLDAKKYDLLAKNIAASCLHVISRLYR